MTITVLTFAGIREIVGTSELHIGCEGATTVAELRLSLQRLYPKLNGLLPACLIAVNEVAATDTTGLRPGDVVAILPPVNGG